MLRYKITPPVIADAVDRPRLVRRCGERPVVVLEAPTGFGKTVLAAQIADAAGLPVAWCTPDELDSDPIALLTLLGGAITQGWGVAASPSHSDLEADAIRALGEQVQAARQPGSLVIDDAHVIPDDVLALVLRTFRGCAPTAQVIVATRGPLPAACVEQIASGEAALIRSIDLTLTADECAVIAGEATRGGELHTLSGGWPLAAQLLARNGQSMQRDDRPGLAALDALVRSQLAGVSDRDRAVVGVLAHVPGFPASLLDSLAPAVAAAEVPWIVNQEPGWRSVVGWARTALTSDPPNRAATDSVVEVLVGASESKRAAHLLISVGRATDAAPLLECLVESAAAAGRFAVIPPLVESLRPPDRTLLLDVALAEVRSSVGVSLATIPSEQTARDLVARCGPDDPDGSVRAQALLADRYRMTGDLRLFELCESALGELLDHPDPVDAAARRWGRAGLVGAATMFRLYGQGLLASPQRVDVERGCRLIESALTLLDRAGRSTVSSRAWYAYAGTLLWIAPASEAVLAVRTAAAELADEHHDDAALRFGELAVLEFVIGNYAASASAIASARAAMESGAGRAVVSSLDMIQLFLDVEADGWSADRAERFDQIVRALATDPAVAVLGGVFAAQLGMVNARKGDLDAAELLLGRARSQPGGLFGHITELGCRHLDLYVKLRQGDERAVDALHQLADDAEAGGRPALAEIVRADAVGVDARPMLSLEVLRPSMVYSIADGPTQELRGQSAGLLALLIAQRGAVTVDAALEYLWPEIDPAVGRNRLHGLIHRMRKSLGIQPDGPLSWTDDVLRLESDGTVEVDVWDLLDALDDTDDVQRRVDAVLSFTGMLLSKQFAYDDEMELFRSDLQRRWHRTAVAVVDADRVSAETRQEIRRQLDLLVPQVGQL